jgi:hypothetical protein
MGFRATVQIYLTIPIFVSINSHWGANIFDIFKSRLEQLIPIPKIYVMFHKWQYTKERKMSMK